MNAHLHEATITVGTAYNRPYHAQCSCGTAGDFINKDAAIAYIEHLHFARLTGISETSLKVDAPDDATPIPAPVLPDAANLGGVGHAGAARNVSSGTQLTPPQESLTPPAPPPPPDASEAT